MVDIFFEEKYGKLYEKTEKGACEVFEFKHPLGTVQHLFIKREVPVQFYSEKYYDIVTPYGYGGPLITGCKDKDKKQLAAEFMDAFQVYCEEQRIVSEFIRFHPILKNASDFEEFYDVVYLRDTVGTNLADFDDPIQKEFSKTTRRNIRRALEAGVEYKVTVNPDSLKEFKDIYYSTMRRNKADTYYYFDEDYFNDCLNHFRDNMVLVEVIFQGQVIGMGLSFTYENIIHSHLSGTLEEFHHLYPAYILQYALAIWGKENGFSLIHDGGGRTNSLDDKLYLFKKQFGKNTKFEFHIGRKVRLRHIYDQLCEAIGVSEEGEEFFPAYRSKAVQKLEKVESSD